MQVSVNIAINTRACGYDDYDDYDDNDVYFILVGNSASCVMLPLTV